MKSDPLLTPPNSDQSDDDDVQATKDQQARIQRRQGAVPATAAEDDVDYADGDIPDDYVTRTLQSQPPLPPIQWKNILSEIQWVSFIVLTTTPLLAIYGMFTTQLQLKTFIWAVVYYFITGLGITAGECNVLVVLESFLGLGSLARCCTSRDEVSEFLPPTLSSNECSLSVQIHFFEFEYQIGGVWRNLKLFQFCHCPNVNRTIGEHELKTSRQLELQLSLSIRIYLFGLEFQF